MAPTLIAISCWHNFMLHLRLYLLIDDKRSMTVPQMKGRWYPLLEVMYPINGLVISWTKALEAKSDPTLAFSLMMSSLVMFGGPADDVTFGSTDADDSLKLILRRKKSEENHQRLGSKISVWTYKDIGYLKGLKNLWHETLKNFLKQRLQSIRNS